MTSRLVACAFCPGGAETDADFNRRRMALRAVRRRGDEGARHDKNKTAGAL